MVTNIGLSDNYAVIYTQGAKSYDHDDSKLMFYYGYEYTHNDDEDGEWLFVVRDGQKVIHSYTTTELEESTSDSLDTMEAYLIQGMYLYFNGYLKSL